MAMLQLNPGVEFAAGVPDQPTKTIDFTGLNHREIS
jgi:hypothetical protein